MSDRRRRQPGARLHVPVEPLAERDWERLERRLESERECELAAAPVADLRTGARRLALVTMLTVGVAAGMALMWWRSASEPGSGRSAAQAPALAPGAPPTRVITPPGGASRLALGDATLEVAGDTELTVDNGSDGTITVRLARGMVDCEVAPRPGRAPFHVVADDVVVTVVGTRFSVERSAAAGGVRVGVTRGKVSVASAGAATAQVVAGQEWHARTGVTSAPEEATAAAAVVDAGPRERAPVPAADASPAIDPSMPFAAAMAEAAAIEASDPDAAAARYRQLVAAPGADAAALEEAAYRLARVELGRARWDAAIAAARAYEDRFPRGAHLEEVLWFRVEASCGAYKSRAADAAARAYAAKFPGGAHAAEARSVAVCKSVGR